MKRTLVSLLLLYVFSAAPAFGVEHDLQLWTPITLDAALHEKVRGYIEVNPRLGNQISELSQFIIRPAVEYRVNDNCSFFAGYAWIRTQGNPTFYENRIWQQVLLDKDIKRLSVINRTRLEQRLFDGVSGCSNRLRHMIKGNYPLYKEAVYATASEELFLNLNSLSGGPKGGIDQNRFFVGLGFKDKKQRRVEIGYQYQYVNRRDPFDDLGNHAIVIQSFIGLRD